MTNASYSLANPMSRPAQQLTATELSGHRSLSVIDFRCNTRVSGMHRETSLSYVRAGNLVYRAGSKTSELVAGAILIGRRGVEYTCSHQSSDTGGECLSFRFASDLIDAIGVRENDLQIGGVPPTAELMVLGELAQSAANGNSDLGLDEIGVTFAARLAETLSARQMHSSEGTQSDRRRAREAALWIDAHAHEPIDLETVATVAGIGPYHFLRIFSKCLGVTPHQYLIRCRLRRAARLLVEDVRSISDIALDAGFSDVSNFIRTFHRVARMSPRRFRLAAKAGRTISQYPHATFC